MHAGADRTGGVPRRWDAPVPPTTSLAVLGSTGSIGRQTLAVAREEGFAIVALAAGRRVEVLAEQIRCHRPSVVSVADDDVKAALLHVLTAEGIPAPRILTGREGVVACATVREADTVVGAIPGFAGVEPVLAAASAGKKIALANKESLVVAGDEVKRRARDAGAWILPVDSEHSAIWQCLLGADPDSVERIVLTCSGGPFFGYDRDALAEVTVADALAHPTWSMGQKITVDSATLVNKGFEVIEGCHLFDVDAEAIDVVIHRESIVHSMVEFKDGAVLAQLGMPDMTIPIRFALTFPRRSDCETAPRIDFSKAMTWSFYPVDHRTFPSIDMARRAWRWGGCMPLVYNAANDVAVARFLAGDGGLPDIFDAIDRALHRFVHERDIEMPSFDAMLSQHDEAVRFVEHSLNEEKA